jgi:hypothetical protein
LQWRLLGSTGDGDATAAVSAGDGEDDDGVIDWGRPSPIPSARRLLRRRRSF